LEHIGPPAKAAIPALQYILDNPPEKGPDPILFGTGFAPGYLWKKTENPIPLVWRA
jgi:hypothetical protein